MRIQILTIGFKGLRISSPLHFKIISKDTIRFDFVVFGSDVEFLYHVSPKKNGSLIWGILKHPIYSSLSLAFGERKRKEPNT